MNTWPKVFIMSSNIWKQFSSTVTSDYYTTKCHNILNVLCIFFSTVKMWVAVQKVVQIKHGGPGQLRSNSTLLQRPALIFWHLPYSEVRWSPCGGGLSVGVSWNYQRTKKEKGRLQPAQKGSRSIWLPLPSPACVFHLATSILKRCTAPFTRAPALKHTWCHWGSIITGCRWCCVGQG